MNRRILSLAVIALLFLPHLSACADEVAVDNSKVSGQLNIQVDLREQQFNDPSPDRLEQMESMGMTVEDLEIQRIYIYFTEKPTVSRIEELESMGIVLYPDTWIPPVGEHKAGFLLADMPVDKLGQLTAKDFVVRLDTAERQAEYHEGAQFEGG